MNSTHLSAAPLTFRTLNDLPESTGDHKTPAGLQALEGHHDLPGQLCPAPEAGQGLYILLEGAAVTRVGASINCRATIGRRLTFEPFTAFRIVPLPELSAQELLARAALAILDFQPRDNEALPANGHVATAETLVCDYGVNDETLNLLIFEDMLAGRMFRGETYYVIDEVVAAVLRLEAEWTATLPATDGPDRYRW